MGFLGFANILKSNGKRFANKLKMRSMTDIDDGLEAVKIKWRNNLKDTLELTSTDLELSMFLFWYYNSIIYYSLYV